jgi:hypothetical protein
MLSVLIFPASALRLLQRRQTGPEPDAEPDERAVEGM